MNGADAILYHAAHVPWQFFGGLSLRRRTESPRRSCKRWHAFWHNLSRTWHVPRSSVVWLLRGEAGPLTQRPHVHFLMAGFPERALQPSVCATMGAMWRRLGGGIPFVRLFRNSCGECGCDYIFKPSPGGNAYEFSKFGCPDYLEISSSFWSAVAVQRHIILDAPKGGE